MLVENIEAYEAANLLYHSYKNDWNFDVCLALAEHLNKESGETLFLFDAKQLSESFTLYKNLKQFNKVNHTTLKDIDLAYSLTTIIPLSNGRFLAENF
ncbi:MAG: hypothetical protein ACK54Y_02125 [Bacteroidota bacterium]|jgi:hypothetical protein